MTSNNNNNNDSNKKNDDGLDINKLKAGQMESQKLLDMLDAYYDVYKKGSKDVNPNEDNPKGGASNMLSGDGGWYSGWKFDTYHENPGEKETKIIDTVARAILNPTQSVFKMGILGSSVAAGHDNCHYDNLSSQIERSAFATIWESLDMKLEVQNAGEGGSCGDSMKNQVWCLQQNVSPDVDVMFYSWTYFEAGQQKPMTEREMLVRWSQLLPRQPPVHPINVGGRCYHNNGEEDRVFKHYYKYGYNAICMREQFLAGNALYEKDVESTIFKGGHSGDHYYKTTRYAEEESKVLFADDETKAKQYKESLGTILRNWHPGPLGFQILSDGIIYVYTKALLIALQEIINNTEKKKGTEDESSPLFTSWKVPRPIVMKDDLPPPTFCDPTYCTVDEAPKCLNYELPTFGRKGSSVAPPDDELNPYRMSGDKATLQNWTTYVHPKDPTNAMIPKLEQSLFGTIQPDKCPFPDNCGGIRGVDPNVDGTIVFKLPKMEIGMIAICVCCGKEVATPQFMDNPHVEIRYNDRILPRNTWELFPEKKCVRVAKSETSVGNTGHSYLSIHLLPSNTQEIIISHVITM